MKVFFSSSIHGRDKYEKNYEAIVKDLKDRGLKVQSDHVLGIDKKRLSEVNDRFRVEYYKKLVYWITEADLVVAEVSHGSISIGHEISLALEKRKNVIALSVKNQGPAIFLALKTDKFQLVSYTLENLHSVLDKAINKARSNTDIRFNFFVSPQINDWLDWISREKRIPRAVYLRELLEKEISRNKDYQEKKSDN